jgi:hypothetical protein
MILTASIGHIMLQILQIKAPDSAVAEDRTQGVRLKRLACVILMLVFLDKPSYLEPNSHSMQKPVEGVYPKKIEDRSAIGAETAQKHVKNYIKRGYSLFRALEAIGNGSAGI